MLDEVGRREVCFKGIICLWHLFTLTNRPGDSLHRHLFVALSGGGGGMGMSPFRSRWGGGGGGVGVN